jgi:hypothetical protein
MQAVANGKSVHSPKEIPPEWPAVAAGWRTFLATRLKGEAELAPGGTFPEPRGWTDTNPYPGKEDCAPALVYLASMEFRSRSGNENVTPAFPRLVRAAVFELGSTAVARNRMGPAHAKRTGDIMTKIAEAERMGAKACQPQELARARNDLDRARGAASDVRAGIEETDALYVKAEQAADAILANRRFALQKGIKCAPE